MIYTREVPVSGDLDLTVQHHRQNFHRHHLTKQTKQTVASPAPPSQSVNFMDLVNELNEGKEKPRDPRGELSEIDLLQAHQERVPNQNAHQELLAKAAEQNPRARSSTTDRHLPNEILQEL